MSDGIQQVRASYPHCFDLPRRELKEARNDRVGAFDAENQTVADTFRLKVEVLVQYAGHTFGVYGANNHLFGAAGSAESRRFVHYGQRSTVENGHSVGLRRNIRFMGSHHHTSLVALCPGFQ